jgi:hypothetical protein
LYFGLRFLNQYKQVVVRCVAAHRAQNTQDALKADPAAAEKALASWGI